MTTTGLTDSEGDRSRQTTKNFLHFPSFSLEIKFLIQPGCSLQTEDTVSIYWMLPFITQNNSLFLLKVED